MYQSEEQSVFLLGSEGVEVEVGEELTIGAKGNGISLGTLTVPQDRAVVVSEVEVIGAPIDAWVDSSEPGFPKNEVIVGEGVNKGVKVVRVVVTGNGKGTGKVGKG